MKRLPGVTQIYEVTDRDPILCGYCGANIRSEIIDEGSQEDAHRRWSITLNVYCRCGARNLFYCHWTPYLVEFDGIEPPELTPNESLSASERNPGLH